MADELNKLYECSRGEGFGGEVRFGKRNFQFCYNQETIFFCFIGENENFNGNVCTLCGLLRCLLQASSTGNLTESS